METIKTNSPINKTHFITPLVVDTNVTLVYISINHSYYLSHSPSTLRQHQNPLSPVNRTDPILC